MELEDLMTNRSLLEKISDDSMHGNSYRKHPKQVVIQEHSSNHSISSQIHHVKPPPKDIRIEYNSKSKNGYKGHSTNDEQTALIMEGYGCKCPKKMMKTIKILWTILLVLYIFGMPIVIYHLYSKLLLTKTRLEKLELEFDKHLGRQHGVLTAKQTSKNDVDSYRPSSYLAEKLLEAHLKEYTSFKEDTDKNMKIMEHKIKDIEQRLELLGDLAAIMNKSTQDDQNCSCKKPTKEQIKNFIKGQCQCGSTKDVENKSGNSQPTSVKTKQAFNNNTCPNCASTALITSAVYTRWGKSSCASDSNTTTIYHGYIGSSYHTHQGGGSNYLCLPSNPKYNKVDAHPNAENRGYIHGVEFELGDSNIFDTSVKTGQYYDALCSVCEVNHKNNALMVPGTTNCPVGWKREYYGYLMAQKKYLKRTEFICVDHQPDLIIGTENWGKGAFLHFVETRCGVLPCRKGLYKDYLEISCAVCSK